MKKLRLVLIICFSCFMIGCSDSEETNISVNEEDLLEELNEEKAIDKKIISEQDSIAPKNSLAKGKYSGWICGLIANEENDNNSDVLLINPETKEVKVLAILQGIYQTQACAVSSDGNKIAYTNWIDESDTRKGVCIVVKDLESNLSNTFFSDNGYNPLITYISWMPDNKTLLCNISLEDQQYYSDVICLFNTETEELQVIDKGKVWQGNITLDLEKDIIFSALNQKELDSLIDKYGGSTHIPVEENGGYNYVEFGMPILSPDQTKVMYVTNFCRNMAVGRTGEPPAMLCLASGIYIANITGEVEAKLIYGNDVEHSRIGKVIWGRSNNEIIFDRYYNEQSRGNSDIVLYNIESKEEKILIKTSVQMETQKARFRVGENKIGVCSDGESGEGLYYYDLITDTYEKERIIYKEREIPLWRFCEIY